MATSSTGRLLIACPDRKGIVAAVAGFIAEHGGNLLDADQHTDADHGEFFMRAAFDLTGCDLDRGNFDQQWTPLADQLEATWVVRWSDEVKRLGILVSRQSHCLHDLLWRWNAGELSVEIPVVISNHADLGPIARSAGVNFHHCPIDGDKRAQERRVEELLDDAGVDTVVLARYMQILTPEFVARHPSRLINIHHSFLPAFIGADPYRQAYDRGVKLIGATSHYVTDELDAGPIIAQSVVHVSHKDSVADLRRKGRDLERLVLSHAVRLHVEDKILVSKNKTIVFG